MIEFRFSSGVVGSFHFGSQLKLHFRQLRRPHNFENVDYFKMSINENAFFGTWRMRQIACLWILTPDFKRYNTKCMKIADISTFLTINQTVETSTNEILRFHFASEPALSRCNGKMHSYRMLIDQHISLRISPLSWVQFAAEWKFSVVVHRICNVSTTHFIC